MAQAESPMIQYSTSSGGTKLALRFTQRVLLLKEGNVVADGPPLEVLADPALLDACNLRPTSLLHYLLSERNAVA